MPATSPASHYPKLLGDIGGTNVRLALKLSPEGEIGHIHSMALREHASAEAAIRHYLREVGAVPAGGPGAGGGLPWPRSASLGVAGPVMGDHVQLFNAPWGLAIEALRQALGLARLVVLNDFTVLALSLPHLPSAELLQVGGGARVPGMTMGVLGAGTGLGVSGLVPTLSGDWAPIAGEGGHVTLPACDAAEVRLIDTLRARFGHVSAERVLSGSGLVVLYEAHAALAGHSPQALSPADVTARGLAGQCPLCEAALRSFCLFLGTVASNLAVSLGTRGGLFIGGGVVPRLGDFFVRSGFRARFEAKGRYAGYLARIPVFVIQSAYPALVGADRA